MATAATTTHRRGCTRPGWLVTRSTAVHGVQIATCTGCDAVEIRQETR